MHPRESQRSKENHRQCRHRIDSIGRSNETKRGPKVETKVSLEDLEFAKMKAAIKRGNRQGDRVYFN